MIRRATEAEAALLSELALRSKAHWGYDDAFLTQCRAELTVTREEITSGLCFVLERERVLGFYALAPADPGRMQLTYLFVEPSEIGHGHGRALLAHACRTARARGARCVDIEGDPHAEAFYRAVGARLVGSRPSGSIAGRMLPLLQLDLDEHG